MLLITHRSRAPPLNIQSIHKAKGVCSHCAQTTHVLQFDGFKACFGGEELKRACATLSGALISGKLEVSLHTCV